MKSIWIAVAFAAGIALGVWIGRGAGPGPVVLTAAPVPALEPTAPVPAAAARVAAPPPVAASTARAATVVNAGASPLTPADESAVSQPIDAGPVFGRQFADAAAQGFKDSIAEAHRALEREARDDSWSFPMEAEIQNSLVADTSMGNFKLENLECRATMCELRMSARGDQQAAALQKWSDGIHSLPWAPRLLTTAQ
jgi:hypothetical protein